jgi:hypothetical protein
MCELSEGEEEERGKMPACGCGEMMIIIRVDVNAEQEARG